jgi:RNA polymerase sigma-70 factor, ECF subfamily
MPNEMNGPSRNGTPDGELLQRARMGDQEALGQLIQRHRPYLLYVVRRILRDLQPGDGSDVVQEASQAAVVDFSACRATHPEEFLGWLATIARHRACKQLRSAGRLPPFPFPSDDNALPAASGSSPSKQLSDREQAARVTAALERLPEHERSVIVLRVFEGSSFAAIADQLKITEEAAKKRWQRGLQRLRDLLGGEHAA